ncbi:unnamed protein product [Caenorhabditis auriculariae]|uniref:C2H2-type domain-containing protein n=1 Tax=Caenorhabditis auriculariae TaxID=2777116 RepID=A0A8S1HVI8_9PELO|nr:unnamed protein product [Caenorhabditis auriculariae]
MVSPNCQYITDFTPSTMEPGKSPLAMLAKTCETIGLPDTPSKKSPEARKDEKKAETAPSKSSKSPRNTPASKEPTLTYPGLPKPAFPMGMPAMPFPFYPSMMPYPMPFGAFPMPGGAPFGRMPCPFAMMRQPCMTPGCTQCLPTSAAAAAAAAAAASGCTPEMMATFASHPLFSAYAAMMPSVSGASAMPSYQSLLAASAAAAAASASAASTSTTNSAPSATTSTPAASTTSASTPVAAPKHSCNWMEATGMCGKKFSSEEDLANHVKSIHTPSPPSSANSVTPDLTKTPTSSRPTTSAAYRFNPYAKPTTSSAPTMPSMPPMMPPMGPMMPFNVNALQAMYTQRLMSSMPHP